MPSQRNLAILRREGADAPIGQESEMTRYLTAEPARVTGIDCAGDAR
jgi:hypothetical protein